MIQKDSLTIQVKLSFFVALGALVQNPFAKVPKEPHNKEKAKVPTNPRHRNEHATNDRKAGRRHPMNQLPQFVDMEQVSEGWINKYLLTYRKPDGSLYHYESTSRKPLAAYQAELRSEGHQSASDAVCMVPRTPDGSYILIREFRYPLNQVVVAFPAGLIDEGETAEQAIDRELHEEIGYAVRKDAAKPIRLLGKPSFSSTGMSDESIQIAFVEVEQAGDATPEPSEFIEPFMLKAEDIRTFLDTNAYAMGTRTHLVLELLAQR